MKHHAVVIALIALSAALAGCGGEPAPSGGGPGETPEDAAASMQGMFRYLPDNSKRVHVLKGTRGQSLISD